MPLQSMEGANVGHEHFTKDHPIDLELRIRARDAGDDDTVIVDADGKLVCGAHSGDG